MRSPEDHDREQGSAVTQAGAPAAMTESEPVTGVPTPADVPTPVGVAGPAGMAGPAGLGASCDLPVAPWQPGWTWRHALVAAVIAVAGWSFFGDLAVGASGIGWTVVLGLLAVSAGLVAASYLPRAGERAHAPRDVCAYSPLMMLLAAGFFLTMADGSLWGASPALLLAAVAVLRRTTGSSTCSV